MKKKKVIQINISNRGLYSFIFLFMAILIGIGVYALTPGVKPDPGHLMNEAAPPSPCRTNQVLVFNGNDWSCINATLSNGPGLKTKVVEIGDWNMDITSAKDVRIFEFSDQSWKTLRGIYVLIRDDGVSPSAYYPLNYVTSTGVIEGGWRVELVPPDPLGETHVFLTRRTSGTFDTANFDLTSFNRGWITVTYEG